MREPPLETGTSQVPADRLAVWLPTLARLRRSSAGSLRSDVVAGVALSALLVPVGMGYAEAAGLPAIAGLYATVGPLIVYFLIGPSRILMVGPDSSLLPLVAAAIVPLAAGNPDRAVALGGALAAMVGVICLAAAAARLGFLTDLLSRPIRVGYMNGIALTVLVSQLPKLLGFTVDGTDVPGEIAGLVRGVADGRPVLPAVVIGGGSLVLILVFRRLAPRLPGVLIAVVASGFIVWLLGLRDELTVVGEVPGGLPAIGLPPVSLDDVLALIPTALGIAIIAFADTSVVSRTFAARRGEHVDPDRELGALGASNLAAGLAGGFPVSGSATRTPVAEAAGASTQLTGLVGAGVILVLLLALPGLFAPVPSTALAAVVISAALSLFDIAGLQRLWHQRRAELALALVAFLAVTLLGPLPGIGVAVTLSLLNFIRAAWRPHDAVLGRVTGYKGYHDVGRHPDARLIPGLILFRWDAPLFFANADLFRERSLQAIDAAPWQVRWLTTSAEPVTDVDTTAADMLDALITELARRGVELHFAELKGHVKDRLQVYGIYERLGADHFHPTLGSAVKTYLARYPDVEWHDWEDEPTPPEVDPSARPPTQPGRVPPGSPPAGSSPAGRTLPAGHPTVTLPDQRPAGPPASAPAAPGSPLPRSPAGGIRRSGAPRQADEPGVHMPDREA